MDALTTAGATGNRELTSWTSPQMLRRHGASTRFARARRSHNRVMDDTPKPAAPPGWPATMPSQPCKIGGHRNLTRCNRWTPDDDA